MDRGIAFLLAAAVAVVVALLLGFRQVEGGEKGVIVTLGKPGKEVGPGPHFILPILQSLVTIETRETVINPSFQEILTIDMIPVRVDLLLTAQVVRPKKALFAVKNPFASLVALVQTMLLEVIGKVTAYQAVTDPDVKQKIEEELEGMAAGVEKAWGVNLSRYGLQALRLPPQMEAAIVGAEAARKEKERIITLADAEAEQTRIERAAQDPYWAHKVKWDAIQAVKPQIIVDGGDSGGVAAALLAKMTELIDKIGGQK